MPLGSQVQPLIDARLAAQQTELLKQSDELNNIRTSLSDALAKVPLVHHISTA